VQVSSQNVLRLVRFYEELGVEIVLWTDDTDADQP
jgi:hypothetical protein